MDDRFLHEMRRDPPPEFTARLKSRLDHDGEARPLGTGWALPRFNALAATATAVTVVALLFLFPSMRAWAQAFLDQFRVRGFTAITVNEDRMKQLQSAQIDLEHLIGDQIQEVKKPGEPQVFATPEAAGAAAGIAVRTPADLPSGLSLSSVRVMDEGEARITASSTKLDRIMQSLDIRDLPIPASLDGQVATVHMNRAVQMSYARGSDTPSVRFIQARSPEVSLPAGVDLPLLGEIGLRILGVERSEAHRLAQSIDWRGTLVIPVPAAASSFREVTVAGNRGLMIESTVDRKDGRHVRENLVVWSEGENVYGLGGSIGEVELLEMANSVR